MIAMMKMLKTLRNVPPILGLSLLFSACAGNPETAPTTPDTITEVFGGTLDLQGEAFFTFNVAKAGTVSVTLASVGPRQARAHGGRGPGRRPGRADRRRLQYDLHGEHVGGPDLPALEHARCGSPLRQHQGRREPDGSRAVHRPRRPSLIAPDGRAGVRRAAT